MQQPPDRTHDLTVVGSSSKTGDQRFMYRWSPMSFHPREFKRCTPGINKRKKELPAFVTVGMGLGLNRYETERFRHKSCQWMRCFTMLYMEPQHFIPSLVHIKHLQTAIVSPCFTMRVVWPAQGLLQIFQRFEGISHRLTATKQPRTKRRLRSLKKTLRKKTALCWILGGWD